MSTQIDFVVHYGKCQLIWVNWIFLLFVLGFIYAFFLMLFLKLFLQQG